MALSTSAITTKSLPLIPIGPVLAALYDVVFRFAIVRFGLPDHRPGTRGDGAADTGAGDPRP
ncbi:hypothetical protein [Streptomyces sp. NPDC086023]|uniref:hypothetical protein n=1 Tax=Streptomyces sp. NPDC086023 TaxID=3365746 RepID=UPI0037CCC96D